MYRVNTGLDVLITLSCSSGTLAEGRETGGGENAVAERGTEKGILKDCCLQSESWAGEFWGVEIL